jgi:Protein of unknown function, DUF547
MRWSIIALVLAVYTIATPRAQESLADSARRKTYDTILDLNVRDGWVYYRALKADRAKLDGYVNLLATTAVDKLSTNDRIAFWLNAYNALVLRTVIDQYPMPQRSREYPARSVRQIPGAFERLTRRVAGRSLTLDQIEQTVLPSFNDPRLFLALGRGAVGSGRLRSEVYTAADLERQLTDVANECVRRAECIDLDAAGNAVKVSAVFSWRERDFTTAFADKADAKFATRSPMERAVLAFMAPRLLTTERDFIERNQFEFRYIPFDWSLNDLTGR